MVELGNPFPKVQAGRKGKTEKVRDLASEDAYLMNLYRIYGNQNPLPKTRRGRVGDVSD